MGGFLPSVRRKKYGFSLLASHPALEWKTFLDVLVLWLFWAPLGSICTSSHFFSQWLLSSHQLREVPAFNFWGIGPVFHCEHAVQNTFSETPELYCVPRGTLNTSWCGVPRPLDFFFFFSGSFSDRGLADPDGGRHLFPDVRKLQQFLNVAVKYVSV